MSSASRCIQEEYLNGTSFTANMHLPTEKRTGDGCGSGFLKVQHVYLLHLSVPSVLAPIRAHVSGSLAE